MSAPVSHMTSPTTGAQNTLERVASDQWRQDMFSKMSYYDENDRSKKQPIPPE